MYAPRLERPDRSFFLFGPRGTGRVVHRADGVYEGAAPLRIGPVEVLPVAAFLAGLYAGRIIG